MSVCDPAEDGHRPGWSRGGPGFSGRRPCFLPAFVVKMGVWEGWGGSRMKQVV